MARGVLATGVLMPLWRAIASTGDVSRAYPDEILSVEQYTRGRLMTGQVIDASNVEQVRSLLDPIRYRQVATMGRRLEIVPTTTDVTLLEPVDYLEATLRNRGRARFDATGNIVTDTGAPWIGGNPFPEPQSGVEAFAGITLSWGRHDISFYPIHEYDIDPEGNVIYTYQFIWVELAPVGRITVAPKPYWPGHENKLRYQSMFYMAPADIAGTAFLNIWPYDQRKFPELLGYLPAFKRVRRLPTDERFEPLVPGSTLYLSDAWAAGDPLLTWGNYRIVGRGPFLGGVNNNWNSENPNWAGDVHGGQKGHTFWNTRVEMVPEVIVVDAEPIMFPRAPISKKRVWFDVRTMLPLAMVSYDRRGQIYRSFDATYSSYQNGQKRVMDGRNVYWSWCRVHSHDVQTNRLTRLEQVRAVKGYEMRVNDQAVFDRFLTEAALRRLGE